MPHLAERYLHRCFQKQRITGEWFTDITVEEVRKKLMIFFDQPSEPFATTYHTQTIDKYIK
jgi:hypothetical protein